MDVERSMPQFAPLLQAEVCQAPMLIAVRPGRVMGAVSWEPALDQAALIP